MDTSAGRLPSARTEALALNLFLSLLASLVLLSYGAYCQLFAGSQY
jgi:hypothetical protein